MSLVVVAHGTRDPAGAIVAGQLVDAVRAQLAGVRVELAFADVRGPTVVEVLADLPGPAVVLPAFLSSGYHVRVDLPAQLAGFADVRLAPALGPATALVAAMHDRLLEAGWRPGDRVVLAAASSSDSSALADVRRTALRLSARLDTEVHLGYCATAQPALPQAIAQVRTRGSRVAVASWLLAPGLFHRAAQRAGADLVAAPIGAHPLVVDLMVARYRAACARPITSADRPQARRGAG
ncbi:MAG TPA: CbiX/SirB N-terminal domain-containing protein [Pseudonocardiaceae bacterium]|jgi:sirohydrochlorin ferrochelatase|nr:CbiX/SirB N-terminal domain-containing protein [Pseudonocardiaceae bacterium]